MKLALYSSYIVILCIASCIKPDDVEDMKDLTHTEDMTSAHDQGHDSHQLPHDATPDHNPPIQDMPVDLARDKPADMPPSRDMYALDCSMLSGAYSPAASPAEPPFHGTVWYSTQIITDQDPSAFKTLTYKGIGSRQMYDRRSASFEQIDAHLYDAVFGETSQLVVEVQVNPEFDEPTARAHASTYAESIGRLPAFLFKDLQTVWIHDGEELFGGGNNNLLIHTRQGDTYIADGVLEEVFLHEGAHTSLDAYHADDPLWIEAQRADGQAISNYARDNPEREDIAESLGPYLAFAHRRDRLTSEQIDALTQTIPNRMKYLACQGFDMEILN